MCARSPMIMVERSEFHNTGINIHKDLLKRIDVLAEKEYRNRSSMINWLLLKAVTQAEQQWKNMES